MEAKTLEFRESFENAVGNLRSTRVLLDEVASDTAGHPLGELINPAVEVRELIKELLEAVESMSLDNLDLWTESDAERVRAKKTALVNKITEMYESPDALRFKHGEVQALFTGVSSELDPGVTIEEPASESGGDLGKSQHSNCLDQCNDDAQIWDQDCEDYWMDPQRDSRANLAACLTLGDINYGACVTVCYTKWILH